MSFQETSTQLELRWRPTAGDATQLHNKDFDTTLHYWGTSIINMGMGIHGSQISIWRLDFISIHIGYGCQSRAPIKDMDSHSEYLILLMLQSGLGSGIGVSITRIDSEYGCPR